MVASQSPPPDFPVYGLTDAAWDGPRWLRFYEGAPGEVPTGVHLAHGRTRDLFGDAGPWVEVRTVPRTRFEPELGDSHSGDSLREVALYSWMSRGFGSADLHEDLAEIEASGYRDWSTAVWTLDGEVVEARVAPDHPDANGAWAAFAETPDVFVVVAARGVRPDDIWLARVVDGSTYGVAWGEMLHFPGSIERSLTKAHGSATAE